MNDQRTPYEIDRIEGALRSALVTMALAAKTLENDGDEHGVAWNLRNEIAQGRAALGDQPMKSFDSLFDGSDAHLLEDTSPDAPVCGICDFCGKEGNLSTQTTGRHTLAACDECSAPVQAVPDVLFDGYAVLQALDAKATTRTSPENVSDVLDAIVRILRAAPQPPKESTAQSVACPTDKEK